jgi:hypothetical protein
MGQPHRAQILQKQTKRTKVEASAPKLGVRRDVEQCIALKPEEIAGFVPLDPDCPAWSRVVPRAISFGGSLSREGREGREEKPGNVRDGCFHTGNMPSPSSKEVRNRADAPR